MESSHLVIFSTSGKFITKFNVLRCISLSEILFWTGARGRIPITLMHQSIPSTNIPPPGLTPGEFFKVVKFPVPGQKMFAKLRPRGKKIDKNPAPGDNFVDLQDNFAMIVKPFAFFWYSSLALRLSSSFFKD